MFDPTYIVGAVCVAATLVILLAIISIGRNCDRIIQICDEMEKRP